MCVDQYSAYWWAVVKIENLGFCNVQKILPS